MGIFKETLNRYVRKQLESRQKIISTNENRSNTPAFHAYTTNKYCNIRMASGVDITDNELLELTGENTKIGKVVLENDLKGYGLAKNYILQGGTLLNPKGAKTPAMRRGFPGQGRPLGGAYGDPLMRGNAKEGYGIVPMPGITDFNIRTKSAYGSLREGKVNFVCHNLRQLAVLEILYMRPGYPVLMEWCWDPYIDNKGKIVKGADIDTHYISNNVDFFKGKMSQKNVCAEIARQREKSYGNYDAILGLCKNFSYSARPDGGFNCTTELMAVGESITSLKGKNYEIKDVQVAVTDTNNNTTTESQTVIIPHILDFLEKTHDYVYNAGTDVDDDARITTTEGGNELLGDEDDDIVVGKNFNRSAAYHDTPQRRGTNWITFYYDRINVYNIPYADVKELYEAQYFGKVNGVIDPMGPGAVYKNFHTMHFVKGRSKWKEAVANVLLANPSVIMSIPGAGVLGILAYVWLATSQAAARSITEGYIRLDALCYIINMFCMNSLPNNSSERTNVFQTMNYNPAHGGTHKAFRVNTFKTYEGDLDSVIGNQSGTTNWKASIADCSTDPYVCLMPTQVQDQHRMYSYSNEYCQPIKNSFGYPDGSGGNDFDTQFIRCFPTHASHNKKTVKNSLESIGHIQVNIRYLLKCHDSIFKMGKENSKYSLGKFMSTVLDGINSVMGNGIKLSMTSDNQFPNVTQIVDLNHSPKTDFKDIFEFNVLSNDTIVRDFSFNSAVPSAMSSTIAVGAGDPDNVTDLDGVTFAAMNRGIRNRLYQPSSFGKKKGLTNEEKKEIQDKYNAEMLEILQLGNTIADYQLQITSGTILNNTEGNKKSISLAKSNLSRLQTLVNQVATKGPDGMQLPKKNPPASTPIPIKIDMTLDGIGGMVIGQLFRVNETRLPLQYRNKNVIFVVVAEEQKIDANGQWTTKISGQMQLFPDEVAAKPPTQTSINLSNFNPVPFAKRLALALSGLTEDEQVVESIFFGEGLSDLELQKIQLEFNSSTDYTDPNGVFSDDQLLHEKIGSDYRYNATSTTGVTGTAGQTGNQLAAKMFTILGHGPWWSY
tara:strand:- start:873 stop:4034 length:3162 start_codon:yes stop_codon:yes gene_type:complete